MPRIPNTRPTSIYWLFDTRPETFIEYPKGRPFYCGKTVQNVERRFICHRNTAARFPKRPVSKWFANCGDDIRFEIMEVVAVENDWRARERWWISSIRLIYPGGANVSDGGDGVPGTLHSAETRSKISAAHKGKKLSAETIAKMKGRKFSADTLAKMSAAKRGKKHSAESRAKMSADRKGRVFSPEHLAKIKIANTGRKLSPEHIAKMTGRKHSDESRAKMSAGAQGRRRGVALSPEHRARIGAAQVGRKLTEEAKAKISAAQKGNLSSVGRAHSPETRAKMRLAKKGKPLAPEHLAKLVESRRLGRLERRNAASV